MPSFEEMPLPHIVISSDRLSAKTETAMSSISRVDHQSGPLHKGKRAPKLSVSLYQQDIERLDRIKEFMRIHGFRNLSDSEALRLACRMVEIDRSLIAVYQSMQNEDGRRKQK